MEVASKPERQFSNELQRQYSKNIREGGEFHRSPMQAEVRYLPSHRRDTGILENVVGERSNATIAIDPQRIFTQINPLTQLGAYEGAFILMEAQGASCNCLHE